MTVNQDTQDKEIQREVMEVVTAYSMVQIHEQTTRGNNLMDIVLTTNSSLLKSSNNGSHRLTQNLTIRVNGHANATFTRK
jgi:hypothetical protein